MKILPISVLIPTMNRPETLKHTLDTYMAADYIPKQIVVVDQSQDIAAANAVKRTVSSYAGVDAVYVYQEKPSITVARNNALQFASEDIIICSDDDIDVYSDTLYNVYTVMRSENTAMLAGRDDNSSSKNGRIGYFLGTRSYKKRNIGHVTASMLGRFPDEVKGQVDTQWAMGFFFSVKKSLLDKWELKWDEKLTSYAYAEDLDFSFAYYKLAKKENLRCIYDETVHVKHMTSKEYRIPSRKSTFMYVINRRYLSYKHNMGFFSRMAMNWCDFWRLAESILKREKPMDIVHAYITYLRNREQIKNGILSTEEGK